MNVIRKYLLTAIVLVVASINMLHAQTDTQLKKWYQLDYAKDTLYGISLSQAYDFLKGKKPTEVVVGVIDSGIDTSHKDLKNIMWVNKKEKKGNQKDDDKNGYIDDIHGWNFLGNTKGENVNKEVDEETRQYYWLRQKYADTIIDSSRLSDEEKREYDTWKKAEQKFNAFDIAENQQMLAVFTQSYEGLLSCDSILRARLDTSIYSVKDLRSSAIMDMTGFQMKNSYLAFAMAIGLSDNATNTELLRDFKEQKEKLEGDIKNHMQAPPQFRDSIVQDDYANFKDRYYGNNDLMAEESTHGTHVSGIIAAERNNDYGIDGIADAAKIMTIRTVPDGDEYDKDVALAIIYAVDNGAKVINMSFGKSLSPQKNLVDFAFDYAAKKDVLLIHAAGNDNKNIDSVEVFPNTDLSSISKNKIANNVITVGASSDPRIDNGKMVAVFSNYGKKNVDVFAPGVKIYSTLPHNDSFGFLDGTSMAAPVVAGIAALIRSYYPTLTALEVKSIIEKSVYKLPDSLLVNVPGETGQMESFKDLSKTGGIVNAYNAVKLAAKMEEGKR